MEFFELPAKINSDTLISSVKDQGHSMSQDSSLVDTKKEMDSLESIFPRKDATELEDQNQQQQQQRYLKLSNKLVNRIKHLEDELETRGNDIQTMRDQFEQQANYLETFTKHQVREVLKRQQQQLVQQHGSPSGSLRKEEKAARLQRIQARNTSSGSSNKKQTVNQQQQRSSESLRLKRREEMPQYQSSEDPRSKIALRSRVSLGKEETTTKKGNHKSETTLKTPNETPNSKRGRSKSLDDVIRTNNEVGIDRHRQHIHDSGREEKVSVPMMATSKRKTKKTKAIEPMHLYSSQSNKGVTMHLRSSSSSSSSIDDTEEREVWIKSSRGERIKDDTITRSKKDRITSPVDRIDNRRNEMAHTRNNTRQQMTHTRNDNRHHIARARDKETERKVGHTVTTLAKSYEVEMAQLLEKCRFKENLAQRLQAELVNVKERFNHLLAVTKRKTKTANRDAVTTLKERHKTEIAQLLEKFRSEEDLVHQMQARLVEVQARYDHLLGTAERSRNAETRYREQVQEMADLKTKVKDQATNLSQMESQLKHLKEENETFRIASREKEEKEELKRAEKEILRQEIQNKKELATQQEVAIQNACFEKNLLQEEIRTLQKHIKQESLKHSLTIEKLCVAEQRLARSERQPFGNQMERYSLEAEERDIQLRNKDAMIAKHEQYTKELLKELGDTKKQLTGLERKLSIAMTYSITNTTSSSPKDTPDAKDAIQHIHDLEKVNQSLRERIEELVKEVSGRRRYDDTRFPVIDGVDGDHVNWTDGSNQTRRTPTQRTNFDGGNTSANNNNADQLDKMMRWTNHQRQPTLNNNNINHPGIRSSMDGYHHHHEAHHNNGNWMGLMAEGRSNFISNSNISYETDSRFSPCKNRARGKRFTNNHINCECHSARGTTTSSVPTTDNRNKRPSEQYLDLENRDSSTTVFLNTQMIVAAQTPPTQTDRSNVGSLDDILSQEQQLENDNDGQRTSQEVDGAYDDNGSLSTEERDLNEDVDSTKSDERSTTPVIVVQADEIPTTTLSLKEEGANIDGPEKSDNSNSISTANNDGNTEGEGSSVGWKNLKDLHSNKRLVKMNPMICSSDDYFVAPVNRSESLRHKESVSSNSNSKENNGSSSMSINTDSKLTKDSNKIRLKWQLLPESSGFKGSSKERNGNHSLSSKKDDNSSKITKEDSSIPSSQSECGQLSKDSDKSELGEDGDDSLSSLHQSTCKGDNKMESKESNASLLQSAGGSIKEGDKRRSMAQRRGEDRQEDDVNEGGDRCELSAPGKEKMPTTEVGKHSAAAVKSDSIKDDGDKADVKNHDESNCFDWFDKGSDNNGNVDKDESVSKHKDDVVAHKEDISNSLDWFDQQSEGLGDNDKVSKNESVNKDKHENIAPNEDDKSNSLDWFDKSDGLANVSNNRSSFKDNPDRIMSGESAVIKEDKNTKDDESNSLDWFDKDGGNADKDLKDHKAVEDGEDGKSNSLDWFDKSDGLGDSNVGKDQSGSKDKDDKMVSNESIKIHDDKGCAGNDESNSLDWFEKDDDCSSGDNVDKELSRTDQQNVKTVSEGHVNNQDNVKGEDGYSIQSDTSRHLSHSRSETSRQMSNSKSNTSRQSSQSKSDTSRQISHSKSDKSRQTSVLSKCDVSSQTSLSKSDVSKQKASLTTDKSSQKSLPNLSDTPIQESLSKSESVMQRSDISDPKEHSNSTSDKKANISNNAAAGESSYEKEMPPGTGAEAEHVDSEITGNQLSVSTEDVDVVKDVSIISLQWFDDQHQKHQDGDSGKDIENLDCVEVKKSSIQLPNKMEISNNGQQQLDNQEITSGNVGKTDKNTSEGEIVKEDSKTSSEPDEVGKNESSEPRSRSSKCNRPNAPPLVGSDISSEPEKVDNKASSEPRLGESNSESHHQRQEELQRNDSKGNHTPPRESNKKLSRDDSKENSKDKENDSKTKEDKTKSQENGSKIQDNNKETGEVNKDDGDCLKEKSKSKKDDDRKTTYL